MHSENFQVYEQKPDHHYRIELPNIIDDLGLDPHEFRLYARLKRIAGDGGQCWSSIPSLMETTGIRETKLRESLQKLEKGENRLNLPLIKIIHRLKPDGSKDTNLISILPIWHINGDYYRNKKKIGSSPSEGGVARVAREGGSPNEDKEEPSKKNPLKEELLLPKEKSPKKVVVFSCLNNLNISETLKQTISSQNSEETVNLAVKRCLAWSGRGNDEAAILTCLKKASIWNDTSTKEETTQSNMDYLKTLLHLDDKTIGLTRISVCPKYIEFICGPKCVHLSIEEVNFKKSVLEYLDYLRVTDKNKT